MNNEQRPDIFQTITNKIIEHLEHGVIPWRKTWSVTGPPINMLSRRAYRGINLMLLNSLGHEHNYFLTFNQVQSIGGTIKKGEKSEIIIYWLMPERQQGESDEDFAKRKPKVQYHRVFNIAQCKDIPPVFIPEPYKRFNRPIDHCEEIIQRMPNCPQIIHEYDVAYYHQGHDYINIPPMNKFETAEAYYSTLFHELIHSTGHESRLARTEAVVKQASEAYSIEELTAEMGSCFLRSFAGLPDQQLENSVSYIGNWLKVLKNDKRFVFYAGSEAQKAVHYILGVGLDVQTEQEFFEEDLPY